MIPPIVEIRQPGKAPLRIAVLTEVELGRECDGIIVRDGKISRQHLSLRPAEDGVVVTDLDSSNGTWVNGQRIEAPASVRVGDVVELGDSQLAVMDFSDFAATERLSAEEVLAALDHAGADAKTWDPRSVSRSRPGSSS